MGESISMEELLALDAAHEVARVICTGDYGHEVACRSFTNILDNVEDYVEMVNAGPTLNDDDDDAFFNCAWGSLA